MPTFQAPMSVDACLSELRARRWSIWAFGDPAKALGATKEKAGVTDVVVIWSEETAVAYRAPRGDEVDPFYPSHIVERYDGSALWAIRWILTIPDSVLPILRAVPRDFVFPPEMNRPRRLWIPR